VMTRTPRRCLPLATFAACVGPTARTSVPVTSLVAAFVPGYNRFPVNDFPRLAVSGRYGTVSMVWNDSRFHPLGDILLESFHKTSLGPVQAHPVVLDRPASGGLHMLPALRTATAAGRLDVTWYSRSTPTAANTNVDGVLDVSPVTTSTPPSNVRITNVASNWLTNTSDIVPNFGDYTDAALATTGTPPYVTLNDNGDTDTGGNGLSQWGSQSAPWDAFKMNTVVGSMLLTLQPGQATYQFVGVGGTVYDQGSISCH